MTVRNITRTLAPLLELLELEQPRVVTSDELRALAGQVGIDWPVEVVVRRLRERGWLLDLKTRGVWEFAPAARAGAFGAGDPLIELRATLKRSPDAPLAVAAESAAYLLGLTSRRPDREVVAAPSGLRLPKALKSFRVVRWTAGHLVVKDGIPVWDTPTLIAFMATEPDGYRDWPNVGEWIGQAGRDVSADQVAEELHARPRAAWVRAAYLLDRGGNADAARDLLARAPAGTGPYYLGDRKTRGRYDKRYDVIDSTQMEVTSADHRGLSRQTLSRA